MQTVTQPANPKALKDSRELRAPDTRGQGERRIVFEWGLSNDGKGHRRLAVLMVSFRKAGISYTNYEQHPTEYIASLRNEDEDTSGSFPMRSYVGLSGLGVCREATSRFSRKGLARFAEIAARELKARYAAGDEAVLAYFATDSASVRSRETTPAEDTK